MRTIAICLALWGLATPAAVSAGFKEARLDDQGQKLAIRRVDGRVFMAPRSKDQSHFEKPAVSPDGQHVGWLALGPNQGASYPLPLHLTVLSAGRQTRSIQGDFGMVFAWCFTPDSKAVVYRYQFPHGLTPIGIALQRLKDGKVVRRVQLEPIGPDDSDEVEPGRHAKAPAWAKCVQELASR